MGCVAAFHFYFMIYFIADRQSFFNKGLYLCLKN